MVLMYKTLGEQSSGRIRTIFWALTHGMYNPLETLEEVILSIEQRITLIFAQCSYYCV